MKKFDCGRAEVERLHKRGIGSNGLQFAVRGQKSVSVKRRLLNRGPRCPQSHDNTKQRRAEQANAKSEVSLGKGVGPARNKDGTGLYTDDGSHLALNISEAAASTCRFSAEGRS